MFMRPYSTTKVKRRTSLPTQQLPIDEHKRNAPSLSCCKRNVIPFQYYLSLRKHPFLLALRRLERFARRNGCFRRLVLPWKTPGSPNKRENTKGEEVGTFINLHCNITVRGFVRCGQHMETIIIPVVDPGECPPYFWTKLRPEGLKKFFGGDRSPVPPPPAISKSGSGTKYHNDFRRCTSLHYSYKIRGILKFSR